jgi:uncharacterized protein YbcV (DUF1398 family)
MNIQAVHNALNQSLAGAMTFPEVVRTLAAEGVERYHVDLVSMAKTTYMPCGETDAYTFDYSGTVAEHFSGDGVVAAIRAIQAQRIKYTVFLAQIMAAGCTGYSVYLGGAKAIYFGRRGEFHVEEFPKTQ